MTGYQAEAANFEAMLWADKSQETQDCLDIVMLQDPEWVHIPLWVPHSSLTGFWLL